MELEKTRQNLGKLQRAEIERIQLERLNELLEAVCQHNPFWKQRLDSVPTGSISSLEQFRQIPVTRKSDLVADFQQHPPYGSNHTAPLDSYVRMHQTSGTTGQPLRWLDTAENWDWFMACWRQIYALAGIKPTDRFFLPFSFGPFIGFWAAFEGATRLGNLAIAGGGMTSPARLRAILDNAATVVCCTPTYALRLAEVAAAENIDLAASCVRLLIVAGEPGGSVSSVRERIEQLWGARVIDHWGMTEIGSLATESELRPGGLEVLETECIAEIVDPDTLDPVPVGTEGELLITNLGRVDSPLIRYRTGDLVRAGECTSGLQLLHLEGGILGRSDDMFTIRGNNVFPSSIEAVVRTFPEIAEFRVEVVTRRAMHQVLIQFEPNVTDPQRIAQLQAALGRAIKDRLNFQAEIESVPPESLPRFELKGKRYFRRFESER